MGVQSIDEVIEELDQSIERILGNTAGRLPSETFTTEIYRSNDGGLRRLKAIQRSTQRSVTYGARAYSEVDTAYIEVSATKKPEHTYSQQGLKQRLVDNYERKEDEDYETAISKTGLTIRKTGNKNICATMQFGDISFEPFENEEEGKKTEGVVKVIFSVNPNVIARDSLDEFISSYIFMPFVSAYRNTANPF